MRTTMLEEMERRLQKQKRRKRKKSAKEKEKKVEPNKNKETLAGHSDDTVHINQAEETIKLDTNEVALGNKNKKSTTKRQKLSKSVHEVELPVVRTVQVANKVKVK